MFDVFADRETAGRLLAARLQELAPRHPVIYALLRGGVPLALEIANALMAPLDLLFVRKIGVPWHEELAAGAVVDGEQPDIVLNEDVIRAVGLTEAQVRALGKPQLTEIERWRALFMPGGRPIPARGRTAILVDDGVATGASMRAAIAAVRRRGPARIMVAVPVAAARTAMELQTLADEVVCLTTPPGFGSVGQFYRDFHQLTDEEIINQLKRRAPASSDPEPSQSG